MTFRTDEWALMYFEGHTKVDVVRLAEATWEGKESTLIYFGSFATKVPTSCLHKMPTSLKKLMPKDRNGKRMTSIPL